MSAGTPPPYLRQSLQDASALSAAAAVLSVRQDALMWMAVLVPGAAAPGGYGGRTTCPDQLRVDFLLMDFLGGELGWFQAYEPLTYPGEG